MASNRPEYTELVHRPLSMIRVHLQFLEEPPRLLGFVAKCLLMLFFLSFVCSSNLLLSLMLFWLVCFYVVLPLSLSLFVCLFLSRMKSKETNRIYSTEQWEGGTKGERLVIILTTTTKTVGRSYKESERSNEQARKLTN